MRARTGLTVTTALVLGLASAVPAQAKFLSVDPVTYLEDGRPGMFNRYSYSLNDPINMIDPDGQVPFPTLPMYPGDAQRQHDADKAFIKGSGTAVRGCHTRGS